MIFIIFCSQIKICPSSVFPSLMCSFLYNSVYFFKSNHVKVNFLYKTYSEDSVKQLSWELWAEAGAFAQPWALRAGETIEVF